MLANDPYGGFPIDVQRLGSQGRCIGHRTQVLKDRVLFGAHQRNANPVPLIVHYGHLVLDEGNFSIARAKYIASNDNLD